MSPSPHSRVPCVFGGLSCECLPGHFWSSDKLGRTARSSPGSQAFSPPRPSSRWASILRKPLLKQHSEPVCLHKVMFPRSESHHLEGCLAHEVVVRILYSEGNCPPTTAPPSPITSMTVPAQGPGAQASFELPLQAEGRPWAP